MYRDVELKVMKILIDKNNGWYYLGLIEFCILKEPKYETYRREKRSWRNLWLSQWSYFATFSYDPKNWSDKITTSNY